MGQYTKRIQAVLTEEQYEMLSNLSDETGKPVSQLVREAVEKVYLQKASQERRQAALDELLSLDAPVADWVEMEDEIIRGGLE
jgi:predicted DNA-binding protein